MRITILQGAFLPVPALRGGAVEKMWFALGPEFAARGCEVVQISRLCDGLPAAETIRGVKHNRVRGYDRPRGLLASLARDLLYTRRAARLAPDADIVVTNTFWAPLLLARRHGAIYVDVQRMPKGQMRLYRRARRLRANSSAVAAAIIEEAPRLKDRVRVIPNPLAFEPDQPVDWSGKEQTVLFAGRIHPEKGIALLLEAWGRLRREGRLTGWKLRFIGPVGVTEGGGGEAWVDDLRQRFPTDDVGWIAPIYDQMELNRAYERASVFAYPSLAERGETFGVAVLEAMAWGAVPVVSDLACFRDFVRAGSNGMVFDHRSGIAAAALASAIERAASARPMAEKAVVVRESHSLGAIAQQFLRDFASIRPGTAPVAGVS